VKGFGRPTEGLGKRKKRHGLRKKKGKVHHAKKRERRPGAGGRAFRKKGGETCQSRKKKTSRKRDIWPRKGPSNTRRKKRPKTSVRPVLSGEGKKKKKSAVGI